MRVILETITGRKGIKNFSSLEEYVDFMTKNGDKIKNIVESDLPYDDKPVNVAKPSQSNGWEQVNKTTFGDVVKKAEKGDCILPHKASSVFKDEAKFEPSKASEKADSNDSNVPEFKYEETKSEEPKEEKVEAPKAEEKDEPKTEKVESPKTEKTKEAPKAESKPEEKKEESEEDKEIKESLRIAGVELDEGISSWKDKFKSIVSKVLNKKEMPVEKQFLKIIDSARWTDSMPSNASPESLLFLAAMVSDLKDNGRLNDFINNNYDKCISLINKLYTKKIGDYDLDNDEDVNSFLDEGFKDKFKKAVATGAMAASLASGSAHAMEDPYYDGATRPYEDSYEQVADEEDYQPKIKEILSNGDIVDQYGNTFTKKQWESLLRGEDPYDDNDYHPDWMNENLEESADDGNESQCVDFHSILQAMEQIAPKLGYVDDKSFDGKTWLVFEGGININGPEYNRIKSEMKEIFGDNIDVRYARSQYAPEQKKIYIGYVDCEGAVDYDNEIEEALKIAGVQLNEADEKLVDKIASDTNVYNQARDEADDGQDPDYDAIINSISYIVNTYKVSAREALKLYSEATNVDYDIVKDAWESDGSAWDGEIPDEYKDVDEDVNNPEDGEIDEKTGKEKLMEDPSEANQDEIDDLMNQYEDARRDFHDAQYYDDNYSWREAEDRATRKMKEIENKLKELTGMTYYELFDKLGSKETIDVGEPKYKVGDKFEKNGKIYSITEIDKRTDKSRNKNESYYMYHLESPDHYVTNFTEDTVDYFGFKPVNE